jgi:hypothetical protein
MNLKIQLYLKNIVLPETIFATASKHDADAVDQNNHIASLVFIYETFSSICNWT